MGWTMEPRVRSIKIWMLTRDAVDVGCAKRNLRAAEARIRAELKVDEAGEKAELSRQRPRHTCLPHEQACQERQAPQLGRDRPAERGVFRGAEVGQQLEVAELRRLRARKEIIAFDGGKGGREGEEEREVRTRVKRKAFTW